MAEREAPKKSPSLKKARSSHSTRYVSTLPSAHRPLVDAVGSAYFDRSLNAWVAVVAARMGYGVSADSAKISAALHGVQWADA